MKESKITIEKQPIYYEIDWEYLKCNGKEVDWLAVVVCVIKIMDIKISEKELKPYLASL